MNGHHSVDIVFWFWLGYFASGYKLYGKHMTHKSFLLCVCILYWKSVNELLLKLFHRWHFPLLHEWITAYDVYNVGLWYVENAASFVLVFVWSIDQN